MKNQKLKYRNITISGLICAGSTTLSLELKDKLGWEYWNAGQFFRDFCKKNNIPLEKTNLRSNELTKKVDYGVRDKLQKESNLIMEGMLTGFMARGIPGILKILLICSNDSLRIDRLVNRERLTVEEAKRQIKIREAENFKKWSRVYKTRDFWNPEKYDLVIDTYSSGPHETLGKVLDKLGYPTNNRT